MTHLFLPPTAVYALLAHPRTKQTDFSSLKCFIVGAAPIAAEKFKEAVSVFGPVMYEGFGQTEALFPILVKRPSDYLNSDGSFDEAAVRAARKSVGVACLGIMDPEGKLLPVGERGEIVVRYSMVMQSYYKKPDEIAAVSTFGWHHTSDVGIIDSCGFVTIVDRIKDMIVSGEFNIYPVEIEKVCKGMPRCSTASWLARRTKDGAKRLRPSLNSNRAEPSSRRRCKEQLRSATALKSVEFWPELPRSVVGKLLSVPNSGATNGAQFNAHQTAN